MIAAAQHIPIHPVDVLAAGSFVAAAMGIAAQQRTGEARAIALAAVRALLQLAIIGFVLRYLLRTDAPLPSAARHAAG